ncbi:MAG: flagellar type III secretion system protein FlhB [Paracoccus sp. (in: a-proteobacteria)]|nr:flagellar type III secretion system protein FlhB [Paracoccus sp. (in: a-proteobacteria)]
MSEEDSASKPHEPTEQKLRKAREKGDIPRSTELNAALGYAGAFGALAIGAGWFAPGWLAAVSIFLTESASGAAPPEAAARIWQPAAGFVLGAMALPALAILAGLIVQRALIFTPSKLAPDLKRINPVKNAAQKFGKTGWVQFAISVGKAGFVGVGGWLLFRMLVDDLAGAAQGGGHQWTVGLGEMIRRALMLALGISVVFAALDIAWKRAEHMRRNRMSLKELRDEMKDAEGDPHLKQARRRRAMDIVLNNMLADVEKADVVIVNPTHYAVALKWSRGSGRAPVCVAKGVDEVALRIRARAGEHKVPIWPDPPAARALHATVEIGAEITADHFGPVAAAIRFAEAMRQKARSGW